MILHILASNVVRIWYCSQEAADERVVRPRTWFADKSDPFIRGDVWTHAARFKSMQELCSGKDIGSVASVTPSEFLN